MEPGRAMTDNDPLIVNLRKQIRTQMRSQMDVELNSPSSHTSGSPHTGGSPGTFGGGRVASAMAQPQPVTAVNRRHLEANGDGGDGGGDQVRPRWLAVVGLVWR
jgi:hypothetical protein